MCQTLTRWLVLSWIVAAYVILPPVAWGQHEATSQLTVQGHGKTRARPTSVEVVGTISADAELAGDALTKFRSAKGAALEALQGLGIANLTVEAKGYALGPSTMNQNATELILNRTRGVAPEPPKVLMQESLHLRLSAIDKLEYDQVLEALAKIVDGGKEAGVTFGSPQSLRSLSSSREELSTFATFLVDDLAAMREQAEVQALQNARTTATRLAKLSGLELGEIRAVQESNYLASSLRPSSPEQSSKFEDLEVSVTLQVQFALRPALGAAEKKP